MQRRMGVARAKRVDQGMLLMLLFRPTTRPLQTAARRSSQGRNHQQRTCFAMQAPLLHTSSLMPNLIPANYLANLQSLALDFLPSVLLLTEKSTFHCMQQCTG